MRFHPSDTFVRTTLIGILLVTALGFFGGFESLWAFSTHPAHRATSLALLAGTLRYPVELAAGMPFADLQVYNGAFYTNWGYGVPLLQAPFHFFTQVTGIGREGFFPDRLIFFFYLSLTVIFLFRSLSDFFGNKAHFTAAVTFSILVFGVLWLIAGRFQVYEETLAYFAIAQLAALSAFLHYSRNPSRKWAGLLAFLAGLAFLIRPTGAPYLLLWGVLLYSFHRRRKDLALFGQVLIPFVAVWMLSNFVRTGDLLSFGQGNATPIIPSFILARFYPPCATTWAGIYEIFLHTGALLFTHDRELSPLLQSCGFGLQFTESAPLLSPGLLPLLLFCLGYHLRKKAKDWLPWMPLVTMSALWGLYGFTATAFCDRYAGDFWPALWVFFALFLYRHGGEILKYSRSISVVLLLVSLGRISFTIIPFYFPASFTLSPEGIVDPPQPRRHFTSHLICGEGDAYGWAKDCRVEKVSNFFLSLPESNAKEFTLETGSGSDRPEQVYINGKIYRPESNSVPFSVNPVLLASPVVQVTLLWPKKDLRLLSAEIRKK